MIRADDAVIVYANSAFARMLGYDPGELAGQPISVVNAPTDRAPAELAHDNSERKRLEDPLRDLADHDSLTGLPNRRVFEEALLILGGDEFAVLLAHVDDGHAAAFAFAHQLQHAIAAAGIQEGGHELRVRASVGLELINEHTATDELVLAASGARSSEAVDV